MKNRIELAEHFRDLGFNRGAEIGVCDGRYSEILMKTIPNLMLIGVDPYIPYDGYKDFRKETTLDSKLAQAKKLLSPFPNYFLIISRSLEASTLIPNESIDFVFIDANHEYEYVLQDIKAWYPKVRKGGIVSGHDYYNFKSGRGGVVKAVDEFVKDNNLKLETTEWDENAHRDDRQPDWFFTR
jgi:hypothetical protein